jgi:hypothetical protein
MATVIQIQAFLARDLILESISFLSLIGQLELAFQMWGVNPIVHGLSNCGGWCWVFKQKNKRIELMMRL